MNITEIKTLYGMVDSIEDVDEAKTYLSILKKEKENHASALEEEIDALEDSQKILLYDDYAVANNYERCYPMEELDMMVGSDVPSEILKQFDLQKFNLNHEYFWTDRYGDYVSGDGSEFLYDNFYASDIANWLEREDYDVPAIANEGLTDWVEKMEELQIHINELEERIEELEN